MTITFGKQDDEEIVFVPGDLQILIGYDVPEKMFDVECHGKTIKVYRLSIKLEIVEDGKCGFDVEYLVPYFGPENGSSDDDDDNDNDNDRKYLYGAKIPCSFSAQDVARTIDAYFKQYTNEKPFMFLD